MIILSSDDGESNCKPLIFAAIMFRIFLLQDSFAEI